jgi:hypothetical protein
MKRSLAAVARAKVDEIGRKQTLPLGEGGDPKIPNRDAALAALRKWATGRDGKDYLAALAEDDLTRLYNDWLRGRLDDSTPLGEAEQLAFDILGDIPLRWELSPNRFANFVECNRTEVRAALRQADVKADNAAAHRQRLHDAADRVLPYLTTDTMLVREAMREMQLTAPRA